MSSSAELLLFSYDSLVARRINRFFCVFIPQLVFVAVAVSLGNSGSADARASSEPDENENSQETKKKAAIAVRVLGHRTARAADIANECVRY